LSNTGKIGFSSAKVSSSFGSDVMKMASAPLVIQALSFFITPIITRLYNPEAYGILTIFSSIVDPIAGFAGMGYCTAIMIAKNSEETANIVGVCLLTTFALSLAASLVIVGGGSTFETHMTNLGLVNVLWLMPIFIFMHGTYMVFRYWTMQNGEFGSLARANIARFVSDNSYTLSTGILFGSSGINLIIGGILGGIASPIVLWRQIWKKGSWRIIKQISWSRILAVSKRYRKFPLYNVWIDLLSRFSGLVPIYLLLYYFSQTVVGYYALGLRLLNMPMSLLGNSIGEVFFQRDTQTGMMNSEDRLIKLYKILVYLSMLPFMLLAITGEEIFVIIFGQAWSEAGIYAQILSFYILIRFITLPASYLAIRMEKQEYSLLFNVVNIIFHCVSLVAGGILGSVYWAILLLSLSGGISHGIFGFWLMNLAGMKLSTAFHTIIEAIFTSLPVAAIVAIAKWYFHSPPIMTLIMCCGGATIMFAITLKRNENLQNYVKAVCKKLGPSKSTS
jgi:O-antigen/teichoic acid export membrane protein